MSSPGVKTTTEDNFYIDTNTVSIRGVFAGNFPRGPINQPILVNNVEKLIRIFGKPTDDNYNDWYQCFNFLKYDGSVYVVRTGKGRVIPIAEEIIFVPPPPEYIDAFGFQWGEYEEYK